MAEISGKRAKVRYTATAISSATGLAATRSTGAGTETGYVQVNSTSQRHWTRASATGFTLLLNGTAVAATNYDLNTVQGKFQWRTGDPVVGTYTANVRYHTASYLTGGREWNLTVNSDMLDTTTFSTSTGNVQWRTFIAGLSDWSADIERLHSTGDTGPVFFDRLNLPSDVIVELVMENFDRFEGWGRIESDGFEAPIDDLVAESVTIMGDGELYKSSS